MDKKEIIKELEKILELDIDYTDRYDVAYNMGVLQSKIEHILEALKNEKL